MKTLTRLLQMKILLAHKMRNTGWLLDFFLNPHFSPFPYTFQCLYKDEKHENRTTKRAVGPYIVHCTYNVLYNTYLLFEWSLICIWRGMPDDKADVPATKLSLTYRIFTLSFPLQSCRSQIQNNPFRKMRDTSYQERQLWSGNESVKIR